MKTCCAGKIINFGYRPFTRLLAAVLIAVSAAFGVPEAQARWFLLPGVYYSDEYGLVGQIVLITESRNRDRVRTGVQYFGGEEGEVFLQVFIPRATREWTFSGRYQISEVRAYSPAFPSNQNILVADLRYWTKAMMRCDFVRPDGFFTGLETSFGNFQYKGDPEGDLVFLDQPEVAGVYTEGQEAFFGFRLGFERRDNRYDSRRGYYVLWNLDLGATSTEDETKPLARTAIDLRRYLPLGSPRTVLALNLKAGITQKDTPYFSRFALGGSESLRGVPLNRYTGSTFYLLRAEFRQILLENVPTPLRWLKSLDPQLKDHKFSCGFVLFADVGDLWRDRLGWWGVRPSVGFGLRAVFPPHVVAAADVAKSLDSDYVSFYLNLAQSF